MNADWSLWRFEYLPTSLRPGVREFVFQGTEAQAWQYLHDQYACDECKAGVLSGEYSSPGSDCCSSEWGFERIGEATA